MSVTAADSFSELLLGLPLALQREERRYLSEEAVAQEVQNANMKV